MNDSKEKLAEQSPYTLSPAQFDPLMARFHKEMPDFKNFLEPGEKLKKHELDYKRGVLKRFQEENCYERIKELLVEGKGQDALKLLSKIVTSNLVSFHSWRLCFGETDESAVSVLSAFLQVAEHPYTKPSDLSPIVQACKNQNLKPAWDAMSTTLWALRPEDYFPIKISYYRDLAKELGMDLPSGRPGTTNYSRVMAFCRAFYDALEDYHPQDWVDVQSFIWCVCPESYAENSKFWVFQADPKRYNLQEALLSGERINWSVNQHLKEIEKGDKVILWETGKKSGCYGLATVSSDIYEQDDEYGKHKVDLQIDLNLASNPIYRKHLGLNWTDLFKDFNGGKQGTNLTAEQKHYNALFELGEVFLENRNYWLYAPGEQAAFWLDNQERGEMTIGWDYLGDLTQYRTHQEVTDKIRGAIGKEKPMNDALAVWQFLKEVEPGDVVIAKKGNQKYIGYGIVAGGYQYDSSRETFRNIRKVDWKKTGEWSEDGIVNKTLTNITTYLDYVPRLKKLMGIDDLTATGGEQIVEPPVNKILYGPPGTGKTYALKNEYFERYTTRQTTQTREQYANEIAGELSWWEVIALVLLDQPSAKVADILEHPLMQARISNANVANKRASIWGVLQAHTKEECGHVKYKNRTEPLLFEKSERSVWSIDRELAGEQVPELLKRVEDWRKGAPSGKDEIRYVFTTFHQSYTYEDFIEGIKPVLSDDGLEGQLGYELKDGVFKEIAKKARTNPNKQYAIFIDEINRGNVASIFGELITLIEVDKREGAANELSAELPYSRETFSVPSNLDIIGTMNTADRSVEALDTALRRRFEFEEMLPKLDVIEPAEVDGVDLRKLLKTINARIERLLDKDHCIGHSYLIGMKSVGDLQKAFANRILPLLEEYFYNDPARIGMVLGNKFVEQRSNGAAGIDLAKVPWLDDMDEERVLYTLHDPKKLNTEAFRSIYGA